jgi:very-short-patch-repair endonuclease
MGTSTLSETQSNGMLNVRGVIERFGIRFLRVTNNDVRTNLYGVLLAIEEALNKKYR